MKSLLYLISLIILAIACTDDELYIDEPLIDVVKLPFASDSMYELATKKYNSVEADTFLRFAILEKNVTGSKIEKLMDKPEMDSALVVSVKSSIGDKEMFISGADNFSGHNLRTVFVNDIQYTHYEYYLFLPIKYSTEPHLQNKRIEFSDTENDDIQISYKSEFTGLSITKKF
ncbi:MAG: hypothetical protein JXA77_19085 [Bacteroidales bacterium]|nr:hypothetical protein [Bacteroidales bacterium]MBN2821395.1 hypothetical protein [Bacteroidales bacterium]